MPTILDTRTGQTFEIDPHAARMARLRRRVAAWAQALNAFRKVRAPLSTLKMITLTYSPAKKWQPNDIREFMYRVRKHIGAYMIGYCWVAELQKRGAVHYHVLVSHRAGVSIPYPDKAGWWLKGTSRIEKARTEFYALKYTQKGQDGEAKFPRGARLFACWIEPACEIVGDTYAAFRMSVHPSWVRDLRPVELGWREVRRWPSGGYRLGEVLVNSPYRVIEF